MKKTILLLSIFLACAPLRAQKVDFIISDGLNNEALCEKIGWNLSQFLTELNRTWTMKGAIPDFSAVSITADAAESVLMLWRNMPFRCDEEEVVERIITTYGGDYQVRNVPVEMLDGKGGESYQELVIDLDRAGTITRVNLAIGSHLYRKIMSEGSEVEDLRHRQMILDYVEHFRTAYNMKDLNFLEMVFSDDALIIVGKVVKRRRSDRTVVMDNDIAYTKYSKKEYLERLRTHIFPHTRYIKVNFSEVRVTKHPTIDGYYGVLLRQGYDSMYDGGIPYSDDGYLFMLWDFRDESMPQIHVRTWQPYWMDEARTKAIPNDKVIDINDFRITK